MEFIPDRWDKEPDVLQGDTAKFEHRKRQTQFPGLVMSKADTTGYASSRVGTRMPAAREASARVFVKYREGCIHTRTGE
jgi:hypothetical protein